MLTRVIVVIIYVSKKELKLEKKMKIEEEILSNSLHMPALPWYQKQTNALSKEWEI